MSTSLAINPMRVKTHAMHQAGNQEMTPDIVHSLILVNNIAPIALYGVMIRYQDVLSLQQIRMPNLVYPK